MALSRRAVRYLVLIALVVAVLTGAGFYFWPPAHVLPPESEEIARIRISETENGWFMMRDAAALIPPAPAMDPGAADLEPGPIGQLTNLAVADDDPQLAAWVRACKPAIDRAHDALKIQHFMMPFAIESPDDWLDPLEDTAKFSTLTAVMLATAVLEAKEDPQAALACYRDGIRFQLAIRNAVILFELRPAKAYAMLVREFPPDLQRQALPWLVEFDKTKPPPRQAIEDAIRSEESWRTGVMFAIELMDFDIGLESLGALHTGPARRRFAANLEACLTAFTTTTTDYETWAARFPKLADAANNSFLGVDAEMACYDNSLYQSCLDGMELVMAVELYRDAHGAYPDTLAALAPEFLPQVLVNTNSGKPYYYLRTADAYWLALQGTGDPATLIYSDILISPTAPGLQ